MKSSLSLCAKWAVFIQVLIDDGGEGVHRHRTMKDPPLQVCMPFRQWRLVQRPPGWCRVSQTEVSPPRSVGPPTQLVLVQCFYHCVVQSLSRGLHERNPLASVQKRPSTVLQVRGQGDVWERVLGVGHQVTHGEGVQQLELMAGQLPPPMVQDELGYPVRPQSQLGSESSRVVQSVAGQLHQVTQSGHTSSLEASGP